MTFAALPTRHLQRTSDHRPPRRPDTYLTTLEYDAVGNRVRETDALGRVTDFEYDARNRLKRQLDPTLETGERYEQTFTYDPADNLVQQVDRRGIITEYLYDLENRRTHTTRAGVLIEQTEYDGEGRVIQSWDANRNATLFEYDERGLQLEVRRPLGVVTRFTHDDMGDITLQVDPEGLELQRTHDLRRRVESETIGASETSTGETTQMSYDFNGNQLSKMRPEGNAWTFTYDGADRPRTVTDPELAVTESHYDLADNLEWFRDGREQPDILRIRRVEPPQVEDLAR